MSSSGLANMIRDSVVESFGIATAAKVNPSLSVKWSSTDSGLAIVRCAREAAAAVRVSLFHLTELPISKASEKEPPKCIWWIMGVSGTIRSCRLKAVKHHRSAIKGLITPDMPQEQRSQLLQSLAVAQQTIRALEA